MKMSIREAINQTLHQEMERDERVIVLGEDVASDQGGVYGITDGPSSVTCLAVRRARRW